MGVSVQVSPSLNIFDTLTYNYAGDPGQVKPGLRVAVPVGNRLTPGWIIDTQSRYLGRVKNIVAAVGDDYVPGSGFMAFVKAVSELYFTSMGTLLDASLSPKKKPMGSLYFENRETGKTEKLNKHSLKELQRLSGAQAIPCFYGAKNRARAPGEMGVREQEPVNHGAQSPDHRLLIGYLREPYYRELIAQCLGQGKSVLIAAPDNLTAAYLAEKLADLETGAGIDIYNSEIKPGERDRLWEEYANQGRTGVVVGGQSAVLLPVKNLGLIIADRAGSPNYKRRFYSPYNVNVLARLRAVHQGIPLVEGFSGATIDARAHEYHSNILTAPDNDPESLPETNENKQNFFGVQDIPGGAAKKMSPGETHRSLHLSPPRLPKCLPTQWGFSKEPPGRRRHIITDDRREQGEKASPHVEVHIIKSNTRGIPETFTELLNAYFPANKKILVVLNRKESVNFLLCGQCKKINKCPSCEGFIEVNAESGIKCRRCGLEKESHTLCPKCGQSLDMVEDISIASVKKLIKSRVVEAGIVSISSEGLKEDHIHSVLKRVRDSKIVIATPVIVNPFFKELFDAIIYLRPESFFNLDEYDAAEKIFSMVSEFRELVRSGGTIDIFSTFHFHYSLKSINDDAVFFDRELKYREWFHLPPFCNVYHIEVRGKDLRKLAAEMRGIYGKFKGPLHIKRGYLSGRQAVRGNYKGVLEAHAQPGAIIGSGLLKKRDISIELKLV